MRKNHESKKVFSVMNLPKPLTSIRSVKKIKRVDQNNVENLQRTCPESSGISGIGICCETNSDPDFEITFKKKTKDFKTVFHTFARSSRQQHHKTRDCDLTSSIKLKPFSSETSQPLGDISFNPEASFCNNDAVQSPYSSPTFLKQTHQRSSSYRSQPKDAKSKAKNILSDKKPTDKKSQVPAQYYSNNLEQTIAKMSEEIQNLKMQNQQLDKSNEGRKKQIGMLLQQIQGLKSAVIELISPSDASSSLFTDENIKSLDLSLLKDRGEAIQPSKDSIQPISLQCRKKIASDIGFRLKQMFGTQITIVGKGEAQK